MNESREYRDKDETSKTIQDAYVNNVNRLLWQFKIDRRVSSLQDCSPSMFIVLYERMLQERIPGIVRFPHYPEDHLSNMTLLLYHLQTIFGRHFSVGHIEARRVYIEHHVPSICALIEVLDRVADFVIDQSYQKARRKSQITESEEENMMDEEIPLLPRRDISILASDRSRGSWSSSSSSSSLNISPRSNATPLDWTSHSSSYLHSKLSSGLSNSLEEQDLRQLRSPINSDNSDLEIDEHVSDSEPASSSHSCHSTFDSEDDNRESEVESNTNEISLYRREMENSSTSRRSTAYDEKSSSDLQHNSSSYTTNSLYYQHSSSRDQKPMDNNDHGFTELTTNATSLEYKSVSSDDKSHRHEQNAISEPLLLSSHEYTSTSHIPNMNKSMEFGDTNHGTSTDSLIDLDTTESVLSQFEEKLERKKKMLDDTMARRRSDPGTSTSITRSDERPRVFRASLLGNLSQKIFTVKDSHGQTISSINIGDHIQNKQAAKKSLCSHIADSDRVDYFRDSQEEVEGKNLGANATRIGGVAYISPRAHMPCRIGMDDLQDMLLTFLAKKKVSEKRKGSKRADRKSISEREIESDDFSSTDSDSDGDDDFSTSESDEDGYEEEIPSSDPSSSRNKLNLSVGDEPRSANPMGRRSRIKRVKNLRRCSSAPKYISVRRAFSDVNEVKKPVEHSARSRLIEEKLRQKRALGEIKKLKKDEDDSFFADIRRLKGYRLKLHEDQSIKKRLHRNTALQSTKSSYSRMSRDNLWKYKQEYREQLQRRVEEILSQERSFKDRRKYSLQNMEHEKRLEERRHQLFQEEHERFMRSTIMQRRSVEEQNLRRLLKTLKRLEKEKMIADQARIKEFQAETAKRDKLRFGNIEKFYCDQIQMLREQVLVARRDRMMAEKAQRFELDKMAREVRQEIWDRMNQMREQWRSEEEAKYFRARLSDKALCRLLSEE